MPMQIDREPLHVRLQPRHSGPFSSTFEVTPPFADHGPPGHRSATAGARGVGQSAEQLEAFRVAVLTQEDLGQLQLEKSANLGPAGDVPQRTAQLVLGLRELATAALVDRRTG